MKRSDTRRRRLPFGLDRRRLRFSEPALEAAFREDRFQNNITNIRFAFLAGIAVWIAWGVLLRPHMLALADGILFHDFAALEAGGPQTIAALKTDVS